MKKYMVIFLLIVAAILISYTFFFQERNVEEKIKTSSCEELKDGYIHTTICKNIMGQDICKGKLLFEFLDRCVEKNDEFIIGGD